jgi:hypothetical protein
LPQSCRTKSRHRHLTCSGVPRSLSLGCRELSHRVPSCCQCRTGELGIQHRLINSALWFGWHGTVSLHEVLITLFLYLTAPVPAHLLVQAALRLAPGQRPPPLGRS